MSYSIGQLSDRAGVKVPTIRYYEQVGLLPEAPRNSGNQRRYEASHLERLRFIKHARELGFETENIRALLSMTEEPQSNCHAAHSIARKHLSVIGERIAQLRLLETELERMVAECEDGRVCDCRVIKVLADHAECCTDHGKVTLPG